MFKKKKKDEQRLYFHPPITTDYHYIFQLSVAFNFYQCVTKEINY